MSDDSVEDGDALDWTPEQALQHALQKETEKPCSKILIIRLFDEDNLYSTNTINSGMKTTEIVSLCEIVKSAKIAEILGINPNG